MEISANLIENSHVKLNYQVDVIKYKRNFLQVFGIHIQNVCFSQFFCIIWCLQRIYIN